MTCPKYLVLVHLDLVLGMTGLAFLQRAWVRMDFFNNYCRHVNKIMCVLISNHVRTWKEFLLVWYCLRRIGITGGIGLDER